MWFGLSEREVCTGMSILSHVFYWKCGISLYFIAVALPVICIPRYNIILYPVVENDRRVIQIFWLSYIIPRRKNNNITQNMYFVLFSSHWSHLYDFVRYPYNSRILLLYTFCIWFVTVFLHTNIINIYIAWDEKGNVASVQRYV